MFSLMIGLWSGAGPAISIENPGIRLELFLQQLSKQTGTEFHCPVYLNNEVLAASFQNQSIDIVKSQLARVIRGTWDKKEDGWWLIQTPEQKKEEAKWSWDFRNKILQFQIDGLKAVAPKAEWTIKDAENYWIERKSLRKKGGEAPKSFAQQMAMELQQPDARFCALIASKLTPNMFTHDPLKFSVSTYSIHGLPGHIDLPIDIGDSIGRYERERNLYQMVSESNSPKGAASHVEVQLFFGEQNLIRFTWLDKDWKYIESSAPSIFLGARQFRAKGEVFPLSKETKQIMAYQKELTSGPYAAPTFEKYKNAPFFADAVSVLEHATKRDPLGLFQGRCWIDFAKSVQKPLLVNLKDDDQITRTTNCVPTVAQTRFVIGMTREDNDGWVLGRPVDPQLNRSWRVDRGLIEEYARLLRVKMTPNLYPLVQLNALIANYTLFSSGIPNGQFLLDDRRVSTDLTAVLGTLSEAQLDDCLKGNRIPVGSLSAQGQDLMQILARQGSLSSLTPFNVPAGTSGLCPLYYLPNGTQGMSIGASMKIDPEFRFDSEPDQDYPKVLSVDSFARLLKKSKKESSVFDAEFKLGTKRTIVGTAYLGQKSQSDGTSIPIPDDAAPTYTWKTLPVEIRQQVLNAMKR